MDDIIRQQIRNILIGRGEFEPSEIDKIIDDNFSNGLKTLPEEQIKDVFTKVKFVYDEAQKCAKKVIQLSIYTTVGFVVKENGLVAIPNKIDKFTMMEFDPTNYTEMLGKIGEKEIFNILDIESLKDIKKRYPIKGEFIEGCYINKNVFGVLYTHHRNDRKDYSIVIDKNSNNIATPKYLVIDYFNPQKIFGFIQLSKNKCTGSKIQFSHFDENILSIRHIDFTISDKDYSKIHLEKYLQTYNPSQI